MGQINSLIGKFGTKIYIYAPPFFQFLSLVLVCQSLCGYNMSNHKCMSTIILSGDVYILIYCAYNLVITMFSTLKTICRKASGNYCIIMIQTMKQEVCSYHHTLEFCSYYMDTLGYFCVQL